LGVVGRNSKTYEVSPSINQLIYLQKSAEKRDPGTPVKNPGLKRKNSKFDLQDNEENVLFRVSLFENLLKSFSLNSNMIKPKRALRLFGSS
jgi:hypothetical protein